MNRLLLSVMLLLAAGSARAAEGPQFGLPLDCEMGKTCFVQQYPDMDGGPGTADPFCTGASYDGHKGTDIRVRYMSDIAGNVPVVASAAGTVLRLRDGVADRPVRNKADRKAVADRECGNGVVIGHGDGWETQYCHLKRGSITVQEGQAVKKGDTLGAIGASGMAQFPHVHITVRRGGTVIDPFTGHDLGTGCDAGEAARAALWDPQARRAMTVSPTQLLDAGFAPGPVKHSSLVDQPPPELSTTAGAWVGWANLINLRKGDRIVLTLTPPGGKPLRNAIKPLERDKASYSLFTGKRGRPPRGDYRLRVEVLRDGKPVLGETRDMTLH